MALREKGFHEFEDFGGGEVEVLEAFSLLWYVWLPNTHALVMLGGNVFRPCWVNSGCSMVYLSNFSMVFSVGNMSLQWEISTICIVRLGFGCGGCT